MVIGVDDTEMIHEDFLYLVMFRRWSDNDALASTPLVARRPFCRLSVAGDFSLHGDRNDLASTLKTLLPVTRKSVLLNFT